MEHFNKLTPEENERLAILMEECGEVIHVIGKIQRHGYDSYNPFDTNNTTNRELLSKELGNVQHALSLLLTNHDISVEVLFNEIAGRPTKILPYLHYNHDPKGE